MFLRANGLAKKRLFPYRMGEHYRTARLSLWLKAAWPLEASARGLSRTAWAAEIVWNRERANAQNSCIRLMPQMIAGVGDFP